MNIINSSIYRIKAKFKPRKPTFRPELEEQGIELLEYMLHRQGHVTVAAGQVKIILLVGNQITLYGATDVFV